jgi:hypothetical protein
MPPAGAIVMFPSPAAALAVAPAEAVSVAAGLPVAFGDCAGAVEEDGPAEGVAAAAADADADVGASEGRSEGDADSAEADKDWLAEQPATARAAKTAQAGATLTVIRRAVPSAGAHGDSADAGGGITHWGCGAAHPHIPQRHHLFYQRAGGIR